MPTLTGALIRENLITNEQLGDARDKQVGAKKPIQEVLVEMGFVKEEDLVGVSSRVFNMPILNLEKEKIEQSVVKLVPYDIAKRYGIFPVRKENNTLVIATSNPQDIIALDDMRILTNMVIRPVLSTKSKIDKCIEEYYQMDDTLYDLVKNMAEDAKVEVIKEGEDEKGASLGEEHRGETSPVVRLVNLILNDAVKQRASDIHVEPQEELVEVRYRIDGNLRNIMKFPVKLYNPFVTRIKIMAELDIAEKQKPQDGRIRISINDRKVDLRISTVPTFYGEKIVTRLLDKKQAVVTLEKIGFQQNDLDIFSKAVRNPQGMILVTGPTGSGKTSTLYAALNFIKDEAKNIITIEDPIEYLLDGINQMQVNPIKDFTFANGLKSILRQDPDVILVGEIRDKDTADIAFRSSQTGHLVFSTLHTNSAASTITRLIDIGLEPYLISSSIILIIAQRLIRCICPHCREEYTPDEKLLDGYREYLGNLNAKKFCHGKGCDECTFTGYLGRTAIFEMLKFNEKIKEIISSGSSEETIFKTARKLGLKTLVESGLEKVVHGITTLEEIERVAGVGETETAAPFPEIPKKTEKIKILVADDEDDIRKVLVKRLETDGYNVVQAVNGKEAVEYASRERPNLVVMDVMMPEMDGFEATKILRSKLETAVIPILMLTAKKDKESELEGIDAGADDYVTKPYDKDKLLARIKMLLKRKSN